MFSLGDAGLAYLHEDFSEHRAFLEERLLAKKPVGYMPESAYWIAFDNAVPTYLPLYMRSRFKDLADFARGGLRDHVLFSTGWEWGWQNDAAKLRMTYALPASWDAYVQEAFGPKVGGLIRRFGDAQHDGLLVQRLAAYLAGRDQLIDAGESLGIVSQPDRIQLDELVKLMPAQRAEFSAKTIAVMQAVAGALTAIDGELPGSELSIMNEEFYQKDNFEKLLKVTIEALNKEKDQFRNQFLLLKKEDLIKTMPVTSDMPDKAKELLYRNRLAKWLTKFFLTPDKEIINHLKALGFDGKFEELFINIETVFNELRQIHTRNIVLLNYPMVVLQIAQYLEMKIPCYIYSDNEAQVVYTDRIKDDIKNQLDNLKERATRGKSEIDKILHAQVTERNK